MVQSVLYVKPVTGKDAVAGSAIPLSKSCQRIVAVSSLGSRSKPSILGEIGGELSGLSLWCMGCL